MESLEFFVFLVVLALFSFFSNKRRKEKAQNYAALDDEKSHTESLKEAMQAYQTSIAQKKSRYKMEQEHVKKHVPPKHVPQKHDAKKTFTPSSSPHKETKITISGFKSIEGYTYEDIDAESQNNLSGKEKKYLDRELISKRNLKSVIVLKELLDKPKSLR